MSEVFARIDLAAAWLGKVLADATGGDVAQRAPAEDEKAGLGYCLAGLGSAGPRQGGAPRFLARFLVWAVAPDTAMHKRLSAAVFAALAARDQVEIDFAQSLTPGRATFVVAIPVEAPLPKSDAPMVTEPLSLRHAPMGELSGVVLASAPGQDETPLARARVEIPALSLATVTDDRGRFRFAALPAGSNESLVVRARGRSLSVRAKAAPMTIIFPISEG